MEATPTLNLANYAQRAYLEYALSVVKGRALPDVCDGQKPVQRRILYAMSRMGLGLAAPTAMSVPNRSSRPGSWATCWDASIRMVTRPPTTLWFAWPRTSRSVIR
jgi:hypothetical protein